MFKKHFLILNATLPATLYYPRATDWSGLLELNFINYSPIYAWVFQVVSYLQGFRLKFCKLSYSHSVWRITLPYVIPLLDRRIDARS